MTTKNSNEQLIAPLNFYEYFTIEESKPHLLLLRALHLFGALVL